MAYIQHFGKQSAAYLQFRPTYPDELYQYLTNTVSSHDLAWDGGTGNGQAAVKLAETFKKVIATDLNQAQLDVAIKKENVFYECCSVEKTPIESSSVDLITVAQALHWFNFEDFYREVKRVGKQNALIAAWSYPLGKSNPEIDNIIKNLYETILGDVYWPKERKYIDEAYTTIPFPFVRIKSPEFIMQKTMDFDAMMGYLNTWSAVKEYQKRNGENPIELIKDQLEKAWGDRERVYIMQWPLHLLLGKVHS